MHGGAALEELPFQLRRGKSAPWLTCSRKSSFIEESLLFKSHNLEPNQFLSVNVYLQARKHTHTHTCTTPKAAVFSPHGEKTAAVRKIATGGPAVWSAGFHKSRCFSWRNASAWHLMTTEIFTVPLQVLYESSLQRVRLPQAACTLHIYAVPGLNSHETYPPRPHPSCLMI